MSGGEESNYEEQFHGTRARDNRAASRGELSNSILSFFDRYLTSKTKKWEKWLERILE